MDDPTKNELSSFKRFLETFCRDVDEPSSEENDSPVRHVSYMLEPSEIEGESLQWALDYLCQTHECPQGLAEHLAREASRLAQMELQPNENGKDNTLHPPSQHAGRVELRQLQRETQSQVYKVCREWNQQLPPHVRPPPPALPVSVHAIKNTRRRMEDRHVVLPDLNTLFHLQDSPSQSYYAVFDGHAGPEAAMFSASQLHVNMLRDPNFASNPELALKRAYATTDRQFAKKAEEQKLRSGSTGVSVLLRGQQCYVCWLGDSQVMLVREGRAVTLMAPHKPNREDEKRRIEELGGFVTNAFGVWRVNGSVAVSRAIGDIHEKPFLCSEADTCIFPVSGREDYVILGCDGVWDVLTPPDLPPLVHSFLQGGGTHREVARHIVTCAKERGSGDNISCIVVFLRPHIPPPPPPPTAPSLPTFQFGGPPTENGDHHPHHLPQHHNQPSSNNPHPPHPHQSPASMTGVGSVAEGGGGVGGGGGENSLVGSSSSSSPSPCPTSSSSVEQQQQQQQLPNISSLTLGGDGGGGGGGGKEPSNSVLDGFT